MRFARGALISVDRRFIADGLWNDQDIEEALGSVRETAQGKISLLKRLLEQAHSSSSFQIHALQVCISPCPRCEDPRISNANGATLQAELKNTQYELAVERKSREAREAQAVRASPSLNSDCDLTSPSLSDPTSASRAHLQTHHAVRAHRPFHSPDPLGLRRGRGPQVCALARPRRAVRPPPDDPRVLHARRRLKDDRHPRALPPHELRRRRRAS